MSSHDDLTAPGGLNNADDYGLGDYELDDELDPEDDDTEWEENEEGTEGQDDNSSRFL